MLVVSINGHTTCWHVGDRGFIGDEDEVRKHAGTVFVQADGHELQQIQDQISGIPMANRSVVCWTGDFAAFIVMNLKL